MQQHELFHVNRLGREGFKPCAFLRVTLGALRSEFGDAPPAVERAVPVPAEFPVIISCGGQKLPHAAKAGELYVGGYFKALLAWASSVQPDRSKIFVLSARHGLVGLDEVLEPYNTRMGGRYDGERVKGVVVQRQIAALIGATGRVWFCGGGEYLAFLGGKGLVQGVIPPGLGIGKQLQWLKQNKGRLPVWQGL